MRKLALSLDALEVQSFATADSAPGRGTVHGEQCTCPTACTCPGCNTCDQTCPETCWNTCDDASCGASWCRVTCGETCGNTCYTGFCICYPDV
jgi:hypothetical protein